MKSASLHWAAIAERGSGWGLRLVAGAYRLLGKRGARLALLPAVAWFFLTGHSARHASRTYLRRLAAHAVRVNAGTAIPSATSASIFRHMLAFAEAGLDKLSAWRGDIERCELDFPNEADFDAIVRDGRGALFISAHLGNLELTRALAAEGGVVKVNAVVYTGHARRFAAALAGANGRFGVNLLEVSDFGPETAMFLKDKVDHGELLVIVGDRTPPADNGREVTAEFLGHPAPFPQGPFILAHLLECPVYLFFCLREDDGYRIHLEPFSGRIILPRSARQAALAEHVQHYAQRLEAYCLRTPLQWFNYFDFWRDAGHEIPMPKNAEHVIQQKNIRV